MKKSSFRLFILWKLPIAWLAGIRLHDISDSESVVSVKLSFLSKNPFKSIFWAVQGMAAELSTGTMILQEIKKSGINLSTLVLEQEAQFTKKAVGKVLFTCTQGAEIQEAIQKSYETGESQTIRVKSQGVDQQNDVVSNFSFLWSFKVRSS